MFQEMKISVIRGVGVVSRICVTLIYHQLNFVSLKGGDGGELQLAVSCAGLQRRRSPGVPGPAGQRDPEREPRPGQRNRG